MDVSMLAEATELLGNQGLAAIGAGIAVIGAAKGIEGLATSAMESTARQPEAGGRIFTSMVISAAFIEGVSLFAIVVCLLVGLG